MKRATNILRDVAIVIGSLSAVSVMATKAIDVYQDAPPVRSQAGVYERYVKRPQDFVCASATLIALSPVMVATAVSVAAKLGRPVIFSQKRPGMNERIFSIFKFRTMTDLRDGKGKPLPDSQRMTSLGRKLRELSLDELPELINIIKGDMAVVGPRPQLVRDMVFMTPEQRKRHEVRPGLTGLAQANGRNKLDWEDRLAYDVEYARDITFLNDWKIVLQTVISVLRHDDTSTEGMDTSEDLGDYLLRIGAVDRKTYNDLQVEAGQLAQVRQ